MTGITQIPVASFVASSDRPTFEPAAVANSPTPPDTARPVPPVAAAAGEEDGALPGNWLLHAMTFAALASLAQATVAEQENQASASRGAGIEATIDALALLGERFLDALAVARRADSSQAPDLFRPPPPTAEAHSNVPTNVAGLANLARRQVLQDYRVAFMVHGRLTPDVVQFLL